MHTIEFIERHLPEKRKALLYGLRQHNWRVVGVDDADSDWALDEKWLIESTRENKGATLTLWFFRYSGVYDGMDRVVATPHDSPRPNAYGGQPSIEFDARKFQKQIAPFMASLHEYRIIGSLTMNPGRHD